MSFQQDLFDYVMAGHSILSIRTPEKDRALEDIVQVAKRLDRKVFVWSIATGWRNEQMNPVFRDATPNPQIAIQQINEMEDGSLLILKDFGPYVRHDTYMEDDVVVAWVDELRPLLPNENVQKTIVFLGAEFQVPLALRQNITEIVYDFPNETQIEEQVRFVCSGVETEEGQPYKAPEDMIKPIVRACKGMTQGQIQDRVSLAMRKCKGLNEEAVRVILHEKANVIRSSGLLNYREPPPGGLSTVGGLEGVKRRVQRAKRRFSDKAKDYGLRAPKGYLLVGVPGCGKTLISMAIPGIHA